MTRNEDFERMMRLAPRVRLGDYIERSMVNNSNLEYGVEYIEGVNNNGTFCKTRANLDGINLKPYKLVNNGDFVYNPARFNIGSIAYRTQGFCIVSHLYVVFRLTDYGKEHFVPEFLFLYIYRSEFFRKVTYLNFGSQRPEFNFFELSEILVPCPPIKVQREIVAVYEGLRQTVEQNEALLKPLGDACHAYIVDCKEKYPAVKLGEYIEEQRNFNTKNEYNVSCLQGVTSDGTFDISKAKTDGIDFSKYKIVYYDDFAYNPSRINLGSIALRKISPCIVSPMYIVFKVKSNKEKPLLADYIMLWFQRAEFRRSTLYYAIGSVRDTFAFNLMQEVQIPLPPIEVQQSIVSLYRCAEEAKAIAQEARELMRTICPALIQRAAQGAHA